MIRWTAFAACLSLFSAASAQASAQACDRACVLERIASAQRYVAVVVQSPVRNDDLAAAIETALARDVSIYVYADKSNEGSEGFTAIEAAMAPAIAAWRVGDRDNDPQTCLIDSSDAVALVAIDTLDWTDAYGPETAVFIGDIAAEDGAGFRSVTIVGDGKQEIGDVMERLDNVAANGCL